MADTFSNLATSITGPLVEWYSITPHDTNALAFVPRAISVDVAGNVVIVSATGATKTLAMNAGDLFPCRPVRINATGTTATGITGWY
jgi:hypothetical protein